jgi:hypothetical protein
MAERGAARAVARGLNTAGFAAIDAGGQPSTTVRCKE